MTWVLNVAGAALVALAVLDIFRTLWHPHGFGGVARGLFVVVWRVSGRLPGQGRIAQASGALSLALTVIVWAALVVLGFALIYWPHLSTSFSFSSPLDPTRDGLPTALYVSLVAVTTLGLGDIVPESAVLRLVVPVEAIVGFLLLSAAISWVLQLYPALARRRSLSRELAALSGPGTRAVVLHGDASVAAGLLHGLSGSVTRIHTDLLQYGEAYYFRENRTVASLAATGGVLLDLVETGRRAEAPEVRHAAGVLAAVLDDLSSTLAEGFLRLDARDTPSVLRAFADDHGQTQVRLG